jgi:hypothetical protein
VTTDEAIEVLRFDLESYLAGADGREHEAVSTLIDVAERARELAQAEGDHVRLSDRWTARYILGESP